MTNAKVKCDEPGCGWGQGCAPDDIPQWHKKPCPQCGKGEIISDADLIMFRMVEAWESATREVAPDAPVVAYKIDTAGLREVEG